MSTFRRSDKREPTKMRPIEMEIGHLSRMDGSARFGFGSDQVLAAFHGPTEVGLRDELVDRATLKVTHRPLEGIGATPSKSLSAALAAVYESLLSLQSHPRSLVQMTLQSLSPLASSSSRIPFSIRAAALNAATLAVLDSGSVGMRATPVACAVAVVSRKGKERAYDDVDDAAIQDQATAPKRTTLLAADDVVFVLDPSPEEESDALARFVVGWAFGEGIGKKSGGGAANEDRGEDVEMDQGGHGDEEAECVYVESEGAFDFTMLQKAYSATQIACRSIMADIRRKMLDRQLADPSAPR